MPSRPTGSGPVPISPARRAAFEVVRRVFEHDAWADRSFASAAERHGLADRERALAQRLAYGAVQRRATCDHVLERLARRGPDRLDPPVAAALRLGLYEALFAGGTPAYAVVDQWVELAKAGLARQPGVDRRRAQAATGLVNAVLRRASREQGLLLEAMSDATPEGAAIAHSYPEWLSRLWWGELGPDEARALMAAMNEPAETALRVNTLRADLVSVRESLRAAGAPVEPAGGPPPLDVAEGLVVRGPLGEAVLDGLRTGELVAQARASQAVVALLEPRPAERVIDLCAGPGVKTTGIAARMGGRGELRAVEVNPARARQVGELCERLGARAVEVVEGDATVADLGDGYDRALVDPPCSDLGALAARPDARWRKSPELIERLGRLQLKIAERAAGLLRPGGTLVFSTCTVSDREGRAVIEELLARREDLHADELGRRYPEVSSRDPRFLQVLPHRHATEGFFIARLRRVGGDAGGPGS